MLSSLSLFSSAADCKLISLPVTGRQSMLCFASPVCTKTHMVQVGVVLHILKTMSSLFYEAGTNMLYLYKQQLMSYY